MSTHQQESRKLRVRGGVGLLALLFVSSAAYGQGSGIPGPGGCPGPSAPDGPPPESTPWLEPARSAEERTQLLMAQMTLNEKVDLVTGDLCNNYGFYNKAIPRVGIPALTMADGPAGVRVNDRNVNGGRATQLPAPIALGATWDLELARAYGDVVGQETFATFHNVILGPTVDIVRTPLWGRAFETYGEDPHLISEMVRPVVRAIQEHPVLADAKHFRVYNQERLRQTINAQIDERAIREMYVPGFQAAVEAGVATIMCSFNAVNGVRSCEDPAMQEILKEEIGFEGFILTDYGANPSTAASALAGLDQEHPAGVWWGPRLTAAVQAGEVPMEVLDDKVRRILLQMFTFGLFDNPVQIAPMPEQEHGEVARTIASQAIVLLKNEAQNLPLALDSISSIALIGPDADNLKGQGAGSSQVVAAYEVSMLDALIDRGAGVRVSYVEGVDPVTPAHLLPGPHIVPSSVLAPTGAAAGTRGLRAQYWDNTDFSGEPLHTNIDRQVATMAGFPMFPGFFASSVDPLPDAFRNSDFSARWTGTITAPVSGEYTFTLTSLGRGWVYLDDQLIIDHSVVHDISSMSATVTLEAGVRRNIRVDYISDVNSAPDVATTTVGGQVALQWAPPESAVWPSIQEAVEAAAAADVAVIYARNYETENIDRPSLSLPNDLDRLIASVAEANPRTIVVLVTGQPVTMPWVDAVPSVLQAWYPGQEQGNAILDVLLGEVNPSGKTPVTFPTSIEQTPGNSPELYPGVDGTALHNEGLYLGYRWYDRQGLAPLFPFGHGLSYTTFNYSDLIVEPGATVTDPARVTFTLSNSGARAGAEVAQVYLGSLPTTVDTPSRKLAGFAKVQLEPGASQTVTINLAPRSFSYWDATSRAWTTPQGMVPIYIASSSRDVRLTGELRVGEVPAPSAAAESPSEVEVRGSGGGGGALSGWSLFGGVVLLLAVAGMRRRQLFRDG